MATNAKAPPPPPPPPATNGVITAPPKGAVGVNRKKQKRRAKQAAKAASHVPLNDAGQPVDVDYDEDPLGYGEDDYEYSDAEAEQYHDQYIPPHAGANGMDLPHSLHDRKKNKKKKGSVGHHGSYDPSLLPPLPNPPAGASAMMRAAGHKDVHSHGNIWNTSTAQERQNIKDFWLSLSEDERKSLLKIEKEAVLRKMKQQQKHSCSCTVCGRKRTAIEEELEVLYEGYYEELEQYAHHDQPPLPSSDGLMPGPLQHRKPHPLAAPPPPQPQHRTSQIHEHIDDPEDEEEEEYDSQDEYDSQEDDDYEDEVNLPRLGGVPDFFNFGQNLTVKDNLLTVADDLLKNDGRKFIEMMEQLAERRMQRESEAEYAAANPTHPGGYPPEPTYNHEDPLAAGGDEYTDEEDYDSQDDYDEDMDEESENGLSEEQRMQEGRRMFQIFAARMFEQRVLNAYREKVAAERQARLLEELQDEDKLAAQRQAKKERDAAKKKEKKKQQQQAKAEEKARKDAEKAAEEARLREAEEKKQEEQRRRKEEQRKKKEEEKRKQDEERTRKEAEKARRQLEEQQRREEAERKAREQKAAEKSRKDEARKREREEREAREKEARDQKAQEEKEKKEREAKAKAEKEAKDREKSAQQAAQPPQAQQPPQIQKRPSQIGMVAVPGVYPKQTPSGVSSPHPSIATPAIPKAPTPAKQRQASQQGSHASSPKQSQSQVSSAPSKSSSPNSVQAQHQPATHPKSIMQKPSNQHMGPQHPMQATSPMPHPAIQPPPGMHHQQQHPGGFGTMSPMGFPGFSGPQGPIMHGNVGHRGPMPMYPQQQHHAPPMGVPNRMPFSPGINGMPPPPPGMMPPQGRGMGFPFDAPLGNQPPPGFGQQHAQPAHTSAIGQPPMHHSGPDAPRMGMPAHSRQPSVNEKERFESAANQPIARPAPIQRPSSVKPGSQERKGSNTDIDDLSKHLGSSALLADDDEPLPNATDSRRHSGMQGVRNGPLSGLSALGGLGSPPVSFGAPGSNWHTPSLPFGQSSSLSQQSWGNLPTQSAWPSSQNASAFAANGAFSALGPIGGATSLGHRPTGTSLNRPLTIRLAICQACKQLSNATRGEGDGYHPINILLRQIEHNRPLLDAPPTLREIEEICETEGDSQNGGGELSMRRTGEAGGDGLAVKFEPDARTPDQGRGVAGLGEIGSPMPSKTSPAFGAPGMGRAPGGPGAFQSLGAVGSSNF
ncbi:hypothetical protein BAUCODRAFT_261372 [Baudoinia panamericana UAMH 10762]|uniref:Stress response protein NST1 n=1 Tax=Baudoinia panamericana (strain UAMH 10762) TaxID=717646 RepID=M2N244_BAUPA|nr:uncharacterized protein BAUCODRAFT_261372 [Baudoinia panamericana UAMH 10762]EMC92750.1 hypothetical protein BAUCODRAFT_261372 [Baudoinia panamericana UAMH 10762]